MKLLASTVLLGAAAAALPPQQHVLQNPLKQAEPVADSWSKPLHTFSEALKDMTAEAKAIWDEVAMHFPEAMSEVNFFSTPKPHVRKPDSAWDYVVKGADIQKYITPED
jgi:cathepsin A (carboxypeptidase C)